MYKGSHTKMINQRKQLKTIIFLSSLTGLILVALIVFFGFSYILATATLVPAIVSCTYLITTSKKQNGGFLYNTNILTGPIILLGLLVTPIISTIIISTIFSFAIYSIVVSFLMPMTFVSIFFYLPLSIYEKYFKKNTTIPLIMPTLTVIVPAYNEENNLGKTLRSIIEADYPNKQIIVVDDGSTDKTYAIASKYKIKSSSKNRYCIIRKRNGGKASAINLGLRFAIGEIVIIIDADSIIERSALKEMVKFFQYSDVVAVAGRVKVLNRSNILSNCTALEVIMGANLLRSPFSLFGVVMMVPGAMGGFRKKSILQRGLYDKSTLTEDFDITLKLLKNGGRILGMNSISFTEVPLTLREFYKQRIRWYRGNFQTLLKHKDITRTNRKYGMLHKFGYPITLFTFIIPPFLDMAIIGFAVIAILGGTGMSLVVPFVLFMFLQLLLSSIAIMMEGKEDWKLIFYSPLGILGYKQIINFIIIKSIFDVLLRKSFRVTMR